ncbi:hypothetical protein G6688_01735 [Polynucleobacter paneuropaeus]|nr:hypothetical protein G6688_01735 [Polynucleobacter paneuropaeus]
MLTNLLGKGLAGFSQVYAIYVFTKIHSISESALLFILLGYAIWFQIFEVGLAQTLQNKFNLREMTSRDVLISLVTHYAFLLIVAIFIGSTNIAANYLLADLASSAGVEGVRAFSVGSAIFILASSNVVIQRILLIFNKGLIGNALLLIQSLLSIAALTIYQYFDRPNLLVAVIAYLGAQILVVLPTLIAIILKIASSRVARRKTTILKTALDAVIFCGIGLLSSVFLGSDYYFAAHFLNGDEVVSYHVTTRIFFISFVIYYAYLLHRAKNIKKTHILESCQISLIAKEALVLGIASVISIGLIALFINNAGFFIRLTNGVEISIGLLLLATTYFLIRVCRDVGIMLLANLNYRLTIYKIHILEIAIGIGLMLYLVPIFGSKGIYFSLTCACLVSTIFLVIEFKKIIGPRKI